MLQIPEGVALFVINFDGKILFLEELEDKKNISKQKGMISIPIETSLEKEHPEITLERLQREEIGLTFDREQIFEIGTIIFQKTKDTISYKLKVYGIFCSYDMKDIQPQKRHEVRAFGSITLQDILQSKKLRREVLPLLQLFEQNKPNLYEELRG